MPAYPHLPFVSRDVARRWVARFVAWSNTAGMNCDHVTGKDQKELVDQTGGSWNQIVIVAAHH
jgi:hypothetical protein